MDIVSLSEAKAHLSAVIDRVEAGAEVTLVRRGKPVATISPIRQPRKKIDFDRIWEETRKQKMSDVDSLVLIRAERDAGY